MKGSPFDREIPADPARQGSPRTGSPPEKKASKEDRRRPAINREDTLKRLGGIIEESSAEDIDWDSVSETAEVESFGFDYLSVLDLIFDLEQEFGAEIEAEEMLALETVGDLVSLLLERGE